VSKLLEHTNLVTQEVFGDIKDGEFAPSSAVAPVMATPAAFYAVVTVAYAAHFAVATFAAGQVAGAIFGGDVPEPCNC